MNRPAYLQFQKRGNPGASLPFYSCSTALPDKINMPLYALFAIQTPHQGTSLPHPRGDRGYMGQGLDGTSQFSACSRNIFLIIFIPYMGINITHTEKNFHRNCTTSLLVMSENKFFLGGGENS
jgi:hypothetical protein